MRVVSFAFALVLVVGVGTSYAAEQALPGEPLYALKVRVTEPLRGTLALTEVSKTEWDAEILERRINEAELLAAEGKWEAPVSEEVESRIAQAADRLHTRVTSIAGIDVRATALVAEDARVATMVASDAPSPAPERTALASTERQKGERSDKPGTQDNAPVTMMMAAEAPPAESESAPAPDEDARTYAATAATSTDEDERDGDDAREHAQKVEEALDIGREELRRGSLLDAVNSFRAAVREAKSIRVRVDIRTDAYGEHDRGGDR